jgi:hypothetical protein
MTEFTTLNTITKETNELVRQLAEIDLKLFHAENALEDAKAQIRITVDPKELGSNEAVREAKIDSMVTEFTKVVRELKSQRIMVVARKTVASNYLSTVKTILNSSTQTA